MGIRETINERGGLGLAIGVVVVGVAVAVYVLQANDMPQTTATAAREWYTIDDGKNWFSDDAMKIPPFPHEGKLAYRCRVWTCDDGKTNFVSHLERYSPEIKRKLDAMTPEQMRESFEVRMIEVKPAGSGDRGWVDSRSARGAEIMTPRCPSGNSEKLRPVLPE